jgi:hypothetical protein
LHDASPGPAPKMMMTMRRLIARTGSYDPSALRSSAQKSDQGERELGLRQRSRMINNW